MLSCISFIVNWTSLWFYVPCGPVVPLCCFRRSARCCTSSGSCGAGEEEIRGFLLFLSLQLLSYQAELPLEALKASIRLVGRQDLLQGFDGEAALGLLHLLFI